MNIDHFAYRHTGPRPEEIPAMLEKIGARSLDELVEKAIPGSIRLKENLKLKPGISEQTYFERIREIASRNKLYKTYIGMGYYNTIMPAVIQRNILENPGWYTSYTPYQAEISQGRLEALLNFQTVVLELTGMELANASLLDEGTAAAEAMIMLYNARPKETIARASSSFFVDDNVFPQTLDVIKTRAGVLGITVVTGDYASLEPTDALFGALVQYPAGDGKVRDYSEFTAKMHGRNIPVAVAADIMSLVLLTPPGKWGADVVLGSTQRFGVPMGYGGPHAAFFATREPYKRHMPGRIIGVTVDKEGKPALRMALQTREQHIKRERATSNICTAQALLASMAGMYAVYHGPEGLKLIARRIHSKAGALSAKLTQMGYRQDNPDFFDTLKVILPGTIKAEEIRTNALEREINFRYFADGAVGISLDETTTEADVDRIIEVFALPLKHYPGKISHR